MVSVVLGLGASHAPQINIPPAMWAIHGEGDKTETTDMFLPDMRAVSYEEALALDFSTLRYLILGSAIIMFLTVTAVAVVLVLLHWVRQQSTV